MSNTHWTIVGQGLAGTCLAWELWKRQVPFSLIDREQGGSSRVAAGLINPVTGKNYEPSHRLAKFLPLAMEFYSAAENMLGAQLWHPLPIIRLAASEKEWKKMQAKAESDGVSKWIEDGPTPVVGSDWWGRLVLHSGGRLDTRAFLDQSRRYFTEAGCYQKGEIISTNSPSHTIWCDGAAGLIAGHYGHYGDHRCAKGEILTVEAPGWDQRSIRIGGGGWLVPTGGGHFKVGATYQWDQLDETPTQQGRETLVQLAHKLGGADFTITNHEAGIRPILRRSQPLIGPLHGDQWMFNALGSKGSLYAPGIAAQLADWLVEGSEPESAYDFRMFTS